MSNSPETRRKRLGQIFVSGLGLGVPFLAAVVALPLLLRSLGLEQFGLFAILWTLIGYSSMFEFGLGKGVTRDLSGKFTDLALVNRVIATSLVFALGLSFIGIILIWLGLPPLFRVILDASPAYVEDAILAGRYLLFAFPFIVATPIFYGVLEARQDFRLAAACRAVIGVLIFALPAIATLRQPDVPSAIAAIAGVRCITTVVLGFVALRRSQAKLRVSDIDLRAGVNLLRFGGWVTVTTLIGPILIYADRFLLTSAYGLAITSLYLIPFEFLIRFMILPAAIASVTFPRFAAGDLTWSDARRLIRESSVIVLLAFGIPVLLLMTGAAFYAPLLSGYVGSIEIWHLAALLAVGFLLMSLTYVPQAYLQAIGNAPSLAIFNFIELGLWLLYTPLMINIFGTQGAAAAFILRSLISLCGIWVMVRRSADRR